MKSIGSRIGGIDLAVQKNLVRAIDRSNDSKIRLATMHRIRQGGDNPAALAALESLRSELAATSAAQDNAARAAGVARTADSGLAQVGSLLNTIRDRVVASAGDLSDAERSANQIEIGAALDAINRIGRTTSLGGRSLLSGSGESATSPRELTFALSADVGELATIELPAVNTTALGGSEGTLSDLAQGGSASLGSSNPQDAINILDAAQARLLSARTEVGAFERFTIGSARQALEASEIELSRSIQMIDDVDVAAESSKFLRSELLTKFSIANLSAASSRRQTIAGLIEDASS
jgi:flagellin